ncbi:MAG: tRNA pseudouridine(38-40) synthase TruA [Alphaproteobacteria bacterium]|nr:tRNA pseudouridine(38-40) synthase TruA [Alphaproteobacteria bacterium]
MRRYVIVVEYLGIGLHGWQIQENGPSVQGLLESALAPLNGGVPVPVTGAGRTDAGVHATGQVAHLDMEREIEPEKLVAAINHHLKPAAVSVIGARLAPEGFHARFSATKRHYLYRIINRPARLALEEGRAWHIAEALDEAAMREGAKRLLGHHDFTSFRAAQCQSQSALKTLDQLDVEQRGDEIRFTVSARSFLHHQVRNMVGTLKLVGAGKWRPEDVSAALEARDRAAAGPTAPPDGLYLTHVEYQEFGF